MTRSSRVLLVLCTLVFGAGLLLLPSVPARGDERPTPSTWVFDVRVVRVETTTADVTETPVDLGVGEDGTTAASWKDLLGALKKRGTTLLLLDQRVTTLAGFEVQATSSRDIQVRTYQNSDFNNERYQGSSLRTGCTAKLKPDDDAWVEYEVVANWMVPKRNADLRETLLTSSWKGVHAGLGDRTLVLSYRQQLDFPDGEVQGYEIYAFLTGHAAP